MDLGFETCGNATLIAYDSGEPVLITDPWISGRQYFGSWALPYRFSAEHAEAFERVKYVWLSHGHPDHANLESLQKFRDKVLLIPKHRGRRMVADLAAQGFKICELESGKWLQLSDRIRILTWPDWNQDAAALIAFGSRCGVLNLNDGSAHGTRAPLAHEFQKFARRFVLRLINYGDADMINFFTEAGQRVVPSCMEKKPLGLEYVALLKKWDATHTAPFSCHHRYARADSQWAAAWETPLADHGIGFKQRHGEFIPGFFKYDVIADRVTPVDLEPESRDFQPPQAFGDDWSEPLSSPEEAQLRAYFGKFEYVRDRFEFLTFRVGGRNTTLSLAGPKGRGLTFEAPRNSLMTAINYEIFDDLLIGNFMKTTLHGVPSLYPDFAPYVAKYGDNGRAFTRAELYEYFRAYRQIAGVQGWIDRMKSESSRRIRNALASNRHVYLTARKIYGRFKSA